SIIALPIYLHFLGYEKYGVWLVLATIMSFSKLGDLGIGSAVAKYVAENHAKDDIKAVERYVTTAIYTLGISGLFVFLVILIFRSQIISAFNLDNDNFYEALRLLPYVGLLTLYVFIVKIVETTLSGLNRMDLTSYYRLASRIVSLSASALLLYRGYGVKSLLFAFFLSEVISHLFFLYAIQRLTSISFLRTENIDRDSLRHLLRFSSGLLGGMSIGMLFVPLNKLIISRYIGVGAIPIYDIAYNVAMNIRGLAASGLGALVPEVSRLSVLTKTDTERILHIYRRSIKILLLIGVPSFLMVFILATPLLQVWLQEKFDSLLTIILRIMLLGAFLDLFSVPAFYTLMGLGLTDKLFYYNVVKSLVNLTVIFLIILVSGSLSINAIGWATFTGMACSTAYIIWQNQKVIRT
ncbi:MAG TPA: oligosaccharide flippase family protein, partial [candidate division Zixibacteria bacterium]|nr:oligosaccharide flippase family protein [candidate division Zixibacteria bacterium]